MCATFAELNCDIVCIIVLFQFQYLVFSRIYFSVCVWFASMFVSGELSWIWHVFRFIHNTIQYYGVPCAMWRSARTRSLWCFSRYYICADVTSKRSDGIYDANHTITNDTLSDEDIFVKKKTFFCVSGIIVLKCSSEFWFVEFIGFVQTSPSFSSLLLILC